MCPNTSQLSLTLKEQCKTKDQWGLQLTNSDITITLNVGQLVYSSADVHYEVMKQGASPPKCIQSEHKDLSLATLIRITLTYIYDIMVQIVLAFCDSMVQMPTLFGTLLSQTIFLALFSDPWYLFHH